MTCEVQFCSSVGGSPIIERLADELNGLGCGATEYSLLGEEEYRGAHSRLARWRQLGLMYAVYPARFLSKFAGRRRPVTRIVTTNPFFMPYLAALWCRSRDTRVVNLLWDLYPDALELAGILRPGSWGARLLVRITAGSLRRCDATVFLGERLREHVERKYGPAQRAVVIPVGADGTPFRDCRPVPKNEQTPVTLLYCGNLGRLHDYRTIYDALQQLRDQASFQAGVRVRVQRLRVAIQGHGTGFRKLQALAAADLVEAAWELRFGPSLDGDAWSAQMRNSDVALVTLSKGVERVMMPSKAYSALVAGQAILAVCPDDSDLADLIREHACGWVVAPGDATRLAEVLREIQTEPARVLQKRRNAFRAGHEKYDLAVVARQWLDLINELQRDVPNSSGVHANRASK
jgi:glycosyltransferase involved in cell wall biosynthesis